MKNRKQDRLVGRLDVGEMTISWATNEGLGIVVNLKDVLRAFHGKEVEIIITDLAL